MAVKTLWVLRGVSGSGKTTLAKLLSSQLGECISVAADDYFYDVDGNYNFDADKLSAAHTYCKEQVQLYMDQEFENIVVHNTNTSDAEIQPYFDMAHVHDYQVMCLVVEGRHGNKDVHNVPDKVKIRQAGKLRQSIQLF